MCDHDTRSTNQPYHIDYLGSAKAQSGEKEVGNTMVPVQGLQTPGTQQDRSSHSHLSSPQKNIS